jgi:predicted  nucleic acid-binding Zn-ribbon protein
MGAIIDALQRLQEVERQVAAVRRQIEAKQRQVDVLRRQMDATSAQIQTKENERRTRQVEFDRLDLESKSHEASIAKHREALNRARTNKEYAAILTAINTERADHSKNEQRQFELLAGLDAVRKEVAELQTQRDAQHQHMEEAERRYQAHVQATAGEAERLAQQREQVAVAIPPSARAVFERVAERHEGEAMAEVLRLHPKRDEYACGGCNMTVTREQVNALRTRDEIQTCSTCGRILYVSSAAAAGPPGGHVSRVR